MVVYPNSTGTTCIGPDYIRLKNRYEVTNGVSEANEDNIHARNMSYLMMLGEDDKV